MQLCTVKALLVLLHKITVAPCPGVTSSGKTYTMATIMQLSLEHLFSLISDAHDKFFLLRLSMLEIYNEVSHCVPLA